MKYFEGERMYETAYIAHAADACADRLAESDPDEALKHRRIALGTRTLRFARLMPNQTNLGHLLKLAHLEHTNETRVLSRDILGRISYGDFHTSYLYLSYPNYYELRHKALRASVHFDVTRQDDTYNVRLVTRKLPLALTSDSERAQEDATLYSLDFTAKPTGAEVNQVVAPPQTAYQGQGYQSLLVWARRQIEGQRPGATEAEMLLNDWPEHNPLQGQ